MRLSEIRVPLGDESLHCTLAEPDAGAKPGLLLTFGMERHSVFAEYPHDIVASAVLAHGRRALSFDLPCHGERAGRTGDGIAGMAAALVAGDDPFARFVADGIRVVEAVFGQNLAGGGPVVACGISRAGYCAVRLAAADRRIAAVAALAPVTDWRILTEFAGCAHRSDVAALALEHWVHPLAGRPVFVAIGHADNRVGSASATRFATRLLEAEAAIGLGQSQFELHVVPSIGHALPDPWRAAGAQFLLRHLETDE